MYAASSNKERWNGKTIMMKQERDFCFAWHKRLSKHCRVLINSSLTIYSLNPEQLKWFHDALTWDVWKCHIPGRQVYVVTLLNPTVAQHLESPDGYTPPAPLRSLKSLNGNKLILWHIASNSQLLHATLLLRSLDSRLFRGNFKLWASPMAQERALISDYELDRSSVTLLQIWFGTHTKRKMSVLNVAECSCIGFDSNFKYNIYVLYDLKS